MSLDDSDVDSRLQKISQLLDAPNAGPVVKAVKRFVSDFNVGRPDEYPRISGLLESNDDSLALTAVFVRLAEFKWYGPSRRRQQKLREAIEEYLDLRGLSVQKAEMSPSPNSIAAIKQPVASSDRVVLYGPDDGPLVDGKKKPKLTNARYRCILALIKAGKDGLTKDRVDPKILYRLRNNDADWRDVVVLPGRTGTAGNHYRIL